MIDRVLGRPWHIPLSALGPIANRLVRYGVALLALATVFSLAVAWLVEGAAPSLRTSIIVMLAIAILNIALQPLFIAIAVRFWSWLFPLVSFGLNAASVLITAELVGIRDMDHLLDAGILIAIMSAATTLVGSLLSISDDQAWAHFALRPLRSRYARKHHSPTPGLLFLEIDGLSIDVLRFARDHGYVPTLARWITTGTHRLAAWECDLSSQTGASQAGILLGSNHDLPAYRWYDKNLGRVVVSTLDARMLEDRLSTGSGLLASDGASRGNLFSGDAPDSLFTFSTLRDPRSSPVRAYYFYFASVYNIGRTGALVLADIVRELAAATWQLLRNERPRVRRFGIYPIVRALTTGLLREMTTFATAGDLMRGVPAIYTTHVAYDEVAHHAGIARGDSLRVLRDIDRDIGRLEREAARAPRPYHLVVLSDHGQSQGPTFRQAFGETLGEHVQRIISGQHDAQVRAEVRSYLSTDEGWQAVSAVLSEMTDEERRRIPRSLRRALRDVTRSEIALPPDRAPEIHTAPPPRDGEDVVVVASGNLGLISFPSVDHRMTIEEIEDRYPTLIADLVLHRGIGFLMARSARNGTMVLGRGGAYLLETDTVIGKDPLAPFGPNAARHLRRTDGFANVPDIIVNSTVDPDTGEVYAFEELVGSHGGLGGAQARPFVLFPSSLPLDEPELVGAESIYRLFRRWMAAEPGGSAGDESHTG